MEKLSRVVGFLDTYLKIDSFDDSCWNGLQVQGRENVKKVLFAVDAGSETFALARKRGADMIVVHHGHFWVQTNPSIRDWAKKRLDTLIKNKMSLYACHIPLDAHATVGNNVLLLKMLGARVRGPFCTHGGKTLSYWGELRKAVSMDELAARVSAKLNTACTLLAFGKKHVRTVGVMSGGGGRSHYAEAVKLGLDAFLTGEATDMFHDVRDERMNVIFAGHHATETLGVKELAAVLTRRLNLRTEFVDIPTGL
jgi:dinuclear metal center YbgI/SA1388 family protein